MKLLLLPFPDEIIYLNGYTKTEAPVKRTTDSNMSAESFVVYINGDIRVSAGDEAGFFYADKLIEQIKFQCGRNLPNVYIKDKPRYAYRSFMIDSCRHFVTVENIKKMIEHCAKLRFNVFHWHLTDDQGWRAEIKQYPSLTQTGATRNGSHFGKEQNDDAYSFFYTREEMLDVVDFAHKNHMTVVPEIDMPGHTSALLASIPSLACGSKAVEIKTQAGIFKDILCAGKDETYDILYDIFDELCDIFTDEYIHVGGDEAPKEQWKSCPDCRAKIHSEGLKGEEALQGYFINRVNSYLTGKNKKVITWNESLYSGILDKDITVQLWMDRKNACKKAPNKIIASDFFHMYTDYPYSMTPLRKVYDYNPHTNENVIGIDIPIWTEYIYNHKIMEYMCFPRFIAAAVLGWSCSKPSYNEFRSCLEELMPYFDIKNAAAPEEWDPPALSRLPDIVNHFGSVSKNKKVREYFLNKK